MYSFGQFCRVFWLLFFLTVVQCFRILQGYSTVLITITSESSPKAIQLKKIFTKNLIPSQIILSMVFLANFCETEGSSRVSSTEERTSLPGIGPGETAGASLGLQTAKPCLFIHLSGIRSFACCFWVGRCVIS